MKALITGATGFVGSHLARALIDAGHSVRALHRASSRLTALEGLAVESALGDLNDLDGLLRAAEGCDWLFHVAAVADYWRADRVTMFEANVEGTRRVLRAAREAGVKRVIITSSAAAIGPRRDGQPASEQDDFTLPPKRFPYGYSKLLAERVALNAVENGQDIVILNPVVIMGPGDLNLISGNFVTQIKQMGALTPMTTGGVAVVDVRDVARAHVLAAERGRTGERYLLGTSNYTYAEWFRMIAQTVGVPHPVITVPDVVLPAVANAVDVARALGINTPIDSGQTRLGGTRIWFDFSKAWKELAPPTVSMMESLRDTYEWYAANGYL